MDTFLALADVNGDAFLYRRDRREDRPRAHPVTVLVDGGWEPAELLAHLRAEAPDWRLDVLAVTHGDADHTEGPLAVLASGWSVGELWLPATWTPSLYDGLLDNPGRFFDRLAQAAATQSEDIAGMLAAVAAADADRDGAADAAPPAPDDLPEVGDVGGDLHFSNGPRAYLGDPALDAAAHALLARVASDWWADTPAPAGSVPAWDVLEYVRGVADRAVRSVASAPLVIGPHAVALHSLVSAAVNIAALAAAAVLTRVPIRWFDVPAFLAGRRAASGWDGVLVPVNAREVAPRRGAAPALPPALARRAAHHPHFAWFAHLVLAALSPANAYGVVYLAPSDPWHPAVVFCGDSDLSKLWRRLRPGRHLASTRATTCS